MKITRLLAITIITIVTACSQDEAQSLNPTLENFQTCLKADMAYNAIVSKFGSPSKDSCCMPGRLMHKATRF
ncbi:MAG: hypothetical protein AABY93_10760 [Bacteroidota bacterium]